MITVDEEYQGRPSKSKRKREAHAITDFAKTLIELPHKKLMTLPLPEAIVKHIVAARPMQRNALKRQMQYIAKLLRHLEDLAPLYQALAH